MGIGRSYNFYIGIPLISHGRDVSIGYVKNDGIVLVDSYRLGLGADISATGRLSIGYYNGDGKPTATSLAGFSYYVGESYAGYGIGYSEDISYSRGNLYFGKNWTTISGSYGLGTPYGVNASVVWTDIPIYLYKSK